MAIGNVAPLVQAPSYSDMVEKQVGLINRERAANLQGRLAQEESNREFRTEQLQNIYDFDVSGLAPGDAANMAELQKTLVDRLDPSSENAYSDSQQLIADLALVNNLYSAGKRWGQTGMAGRQGYAQSIVNPDRGDGTTYVSNEDMLQARNSTWEKGASSGFRIEGGPGETRLISTYLDQDGEVMGEGDYFQNPWYSQPDQFWRAEIGEAPPMNVAGIYADDANIDATNIEARSSNRWDSNPTKVQQAFRNSKAKAEGLSPAELKNEDGTYIDGYTDEQLKAEYQAEAANGLSLRKQAVAPPLFSGSVYDLSDEAGGGRAFELETPIDITTSLVSGTVSHIRLEGDSMTVVFQNSDDEIEEVTVEEGSDAWQTIMDKAGGLPALRAMQLKNGGTPAEGEAPAAEEAPAEGGTPAEGGAPAAEVSVEDTVNDLDAQALEYEAIIQEVGPIDRNTDLQTIEAVQEAQANLREVNERRNALAEAPVGSSSAGFNEYLEEVTDGIQFYRANTVTQNLAKELKGLTPVEQSSKLEDKYNELEASWSKISNKSPENMSSRDKVKVKNLEGQMREVEEMKNKLGFAAEPPAESPVEVIQGEGAEIAYSKPRNANLEILEVGNQRSGSTKPQRKLAFEEATRLAREAGHPFPEVVAAQFAKESSWGKDTGGDFNYFGLKSGNAIIKRLKDAGIVATAADEVDTNEIINDETVTIKDSFLSFESAEDGFMAYLIFIDTVKKKNEDGSYVRRYGPALDEAETAYDYVKQINDLGYSTTPSQAYADSTNTIAQGFGVDLKEITRRPRGTASN